MTIAKVTQIPRDGLRRKTLHMAQLTWVAFILLFLGVYVHQNWSAFSHLHWDMHLGWLSLALLCGLTRRFIGGIRWVMIINYDRKAIGLDTYVNYFRIYSMTNLSLYIPGYFTYFTHRTYMMKKEGVSPDRTILGLIYEMGIMLWTGLVIGSFAAFLLSEVLSPYFPLYLAALSILSLILFHPRTINQLLTTYCRIRHLPPQRIDIPFRWVLGFVGLSCLIWMLGGGVLFSVLNAFSTTTEYDYFFLLSSLGMAWSIGFVTPWAPSGLGIQEGLLVWFLSRYPVPLPFAAAITMRLVYLFEDVFWFTIALIFRKRGTDGL
ncbi:MAG: flippase-like domain-containing protein [Desulfofustis sp.]|nr:flippase-like domain-containing protein [Desulfofustis sp.]